MDKYIAEKKKYMGMKKAVQSVEPRTLNIAKKEIENITIKLMQSGQEKFMQNEKLKDYVFGAERKKLKKIG